MFINGSAQVKDNGGKPVTLRLEGNYPAAGNLKLIVENACELTLKIRKPSWCDNMTVNGEKAADGYYTLSKAFKAGECVDVCMEVKLKAHRLNGKIAFTYGALTLATDEHKATRELKKPVAVGETLSYELLPTQEGEIVRIACKLEDGDTLLLADYQSCGKKWLSDKPYMTVWFNGAE